ncbi:hypothetical protein FPV67DRAFT_430116 [Lyophyllum atratum]|nr:hypothetical protein FPV67DRAFT_430116 [Lyophyllum atratum]
MHTSVGLFDGRWYQEKVAGRYVNALPKGSSISVSVILLFFRLVPMLLRSDETLNPMPFFEYLWRSSPERPLPYLLARSAETRRWHVHIYPAFAAIVALLDDVHLSKNLHLLGFLNLLLHTRGLSGFHDSTVGHNSGCGTTSFNVSDGQCHSQAGTIDTTIREDGIHVWIFT